MSEFDSIKEAILTGKDILNYVWISDGDNPVIPLFDSYSDKIILGDKCHSVVFIKKGCCLYGIVALYGLGKPIIVKLSEEIMRFGTDMYICDWQNKKDYKLIDCVLKICEHDG
ncbi:MAG: hypothetical protein AAGU75_21400, partial [Bacillota bacterium]